MPAKLLTAPRRAFRRARGVAAVELAVILSAMILLLAFPIYFSRVFMHYSVAQKAAQDAARFLSSTPLVQASNEGKLINMAELARQIALVELKELAPGTAAAAHVGISCDGVPCSSSIPQFIRVTVHMRMHNEFLSYFTSEAVGDDGIYLKADVTMAYTGR